MLESLRTRVLVTSISLSSLLVVALPPDDFCPPASSGAVTSLSLDKLLGVGLLQADLVSGLNLLPHCSLAWVGIPRVVAAGEVVDLNFGFACGSLSASLLQPDFGIWVGPVTLGWVLGVIIGLCCTLVFFPPRGGPPLLLAEEGG